MTRSSRCHAFNGAMAFIRPPADSCSIPEPERLPSNLIRPGAGFASSSPNGLRLELASRLFRVASSQLTREAAGAAELSDAHACCKTHRDSEASDLVGGSPLVLPSLRSSTAARTPAALALRAE